MEQKQNPKIRRQRFRHLAISLLEQKSGISPRGLAIIKQFADESNVKLYDIFNKMTELKTGRFKLPKNHSIKP